MQHINLDIDTDFQGVEGALRDIFLLPLFHGASAQIPGRAITGMTLK